MFIKRINNKKNILRRTILGISIALLTFLPFSALGVESSSQDIKPELQQLDTPKQENSNSSDFYNNIQQDTIDEAKIRELFEKSLKDNYVIRDFVRTEIKDYFGWTIGLINALLVVLTFLPVVITILVFIVRKTVKDDIKKEIDKDVVDVKDNLHNSMKEQSDKLQKFREEMDDDMSKFSSEQSKKINNWSEQIKEKVNWIQKLNKSLYKSKDDLINKIARSIPVFLEEEIKEQDRENLKEYVSAISTLTELEEITWSSLECRNIGDAYFYLGKYEKSLEFYDLGIKKFYDLGIENRERIYNKDKEEVVKILNNKGFALSKLKRYDKEIECYEEALKISKNYTESLYNLACAYVSKEDYEQAIKQLRVATNTNPECKEWAREDKDFEPLRSNDRYKDDFEELIRDTE